MDSVLRSFYRASGWNEDNSYENIVATSEALIDFPIQTDFKLNVASKSSDYTATQLTLNNTATINGSVAYLYTSAPLKDVLGTKELSLQDAIAGKPLNITLAANPLLGHISSTYSVKTSINTTFSSRYDFNIYSYDSNLSFGCELWRSNGPPKGIIKRIDPSLAPHAKHGTDDQTVIEAFESLVRDTGYTSVIKLSTSLNDQQVKLMWEGKFKEFLVSAGAELQLKSPTPEVKRCGIQLQYSS
ncbi:Mitochondrial distribution and morphology protein 10 [Cyberlindnera fabianii]|uniref:Mitochondrial distribution and morphology protein 10 n=1 Tax=Cyberlindnera fabianii TaxID=36022 RepID=A0A1V2L6B2_CYBFA|nr:Mitochondrial distribution and morphology protein 10 [Cyberlindnera fabianii]